MPAALIFFFARTSRCAIVASGTRNARAISRRRQAAERAQRQRHLRLGRQRRMAAGEDQLEPLVGNTVVVHLVLARLGHVEQLRLRRRACGRGGSGRSRGCAPVVTSHARGLSGTPSRGQRSAAIANASCAASSARSKSPRKPISAARTRPHCSRKTCSISATTHDGPDLDRAAQPRGRDRRGDRDRRVEVVGLEDEVAAERLLGLDVRAVGGERLAVLRRARSSPSPAAAAAMPGRDARRLVDAPQPA